MILQSWHSPYLAWVQTTATHLLSSVDRADCLVYTKPPLVKEAVAAHLCPTAHGWKSTPWLLSKLHRATTHISEKAYMAAGHAASAIQTMVVLQVFQVKMLQALIERGPDSESFRKLRSAMDLVFRVTKNTTQGFGRSMDSLVVLQRHLWVTQTDVQNSEKEQLLDVPRSPHGLFDNVVGSFSEKFLKAQKQSKVLSHFLPKWAAAPSFKHQDSSTTVSWYPSFLVGLCCVASICSLAGCR